METNLFNTVGSLIQTSVGPESQDKATVPADSKGVIADAQRQAKPDSKMDEKHNFSQATQLKVDAFALGFKEQGYTIIARPDGNGFVAVSPVDSSFVEIYSSPGNEKYNGGSITINQSRPESSMTANLSLQQNGDRITPNWMIQFSNGESGTLNGPLNIGRHQEEGVVILTSSIVGNDPLAVSLSGQVLNIVGVVRKHPTILNAAPGNPVVNPNWQRPSPYPSNVNIGQNGKIDVGTIHADPSSKVNIGTFNGK